jgi:CheY-like chemotaxis protein
MSSMSKGERILVVEDDPDYCEIIADVLMNAGYAVAMAEDGNEAILMAARWPPDLMLSDFSLPGINGVELTRRIHAFAPDIPVVLTTGLEEAYGLCTKAPSYGAVACLKKPMNVEELLGTIDSALISAERLTPAAG